MTERLPIAAILLAAGLGSRFRDQDDSVASKLLAELDGEPLVRHAARAASASTARPLIVVTGHAATHVVEALRDFEATFVHNPLFASGFASSLAAGLAHAPSDCAGALILLADMPRVSSTTLNQLIALFERNPSCAAVVPLHEGMRGNPVLLARAMFAKASNLQGDQGARRLLDAAGDAVLTCEVGPEVGFDVDDPQALRHA